MSKFKSVFYRSSDRSVKDVIGTFDTKETASLKAYEYAYQHGHTSGCDKKNDVIDALMERDFYMLSYGPRELEVEEVVS